jgi:copper chaperone CopZ
MSCGGCENAIRRAVGRLPGVTEVTASHAAEQVGVTFDPSKSDLATIARKIEELGYRVEQG